MTWGGVSGGGSPDIDVLQSPAPCPSPTRGEGTLRRSPLLISALELLVPPLLEGNVVRRHIAVVEIDEGLDLVGREADALVEVGRDNRIGHRRVVTHVDREGFLCTRFEHGVEIGV